MLDVFPFASPRPGTEEALKQIKAAFDSGKRFVLVDAPTGSGKSGIAVAFARKYKSSIWTPTKFLQEQYANTQEFTHEYTIKGKSNYSCGLQGQGDNTVDEAICCSAKIIDENRDLIPWPLTNDRKLLTRSLKNKCAETGTCPYYSKIARIPEVPGAIMNYDLGLRIKKNPKRENTGVNMGDSVVLDEAHQLLSKINSVFGNKISNTAVMKLLGQEAKRGNGEEPLLWVNRLMTIAKERIERESDSKKVSKLTMFERKMSGILELDVENEKKFFIEDSGSEIEIKPLDFRYLKGQIFFPFKKILMLSATFPVNFTKVLGISEEECAVVKIKSTFSPSKRRSIFPSDIANMNSKTILTPDSDQVRMLDLILKAHPNDKGIVHSGNYKFFDQLKKIFRGNKRFIWVTQDHDKEEMFYKHVNSKQPTILVSPAMLEGVDLKDDLARFGVLLKVPYPVLDEYTKRMNLIFPQWYENLTITNVVQAYGRQVRSENDSAVFYILDGAFKMLLNRNRSLIPEYFTEALKVGEAGRLVKVLHNKASKALEDSKTE